MSETSISKRVFFPNKEQRKFIIKLSAKLTINEMATICNCSARTIRDWKREKFSMDFGSLRKLCDAARIELPKNIKLRGRWWYTKHGGIIGGFAVMKKYGRVGGDPNYRKWKWQDWWKHEGQFKKHPIINVTLPIDKPQRSSELAEFIGIILGDGGISRYQITITLNSETDKEYIDFVATFVENLFGVIPGIYKDKRFKATDIVLSRKELVKFCTEELGLKIGDKVKQQVDIPDWIKNNSDFEIACVRGLVDTDGSVFTHRYKVNGKQYQYKKLSFSNRSRSLLNSVYLILQNLGLHPRLTSNIDVRLDSIEDMKKYFLIVGAHNRKHLKKYKN